MEITVAGDQLILSGPIAARDYEEVAGTLALKPYIKIVILRNSPGGDAPTGYHLGELFRRKSLQTAVSGYCYSSCSRLYLGGKARYFTDDYPPEYTQIGFHGHYDRNGDLNGAYVAELHLKDWIIRYSDGKADPALVERWINIPHGTGLIHFYNPALVNIGGYSTFMCQGTEPGHPRIFDCERIPKTASSSASRPRRPWSIAAISNRSGKRSCLPRRHPAMRRLWTTQSCPASAKPAGIYTAAFLRHRHRGRSRSRPRAGSRPGVHRWSRTPRGGR